MKQMIRCIATILLGMVCASVQGQHVLPEDEHDCFVVPSRFANEGSPVRCIVSKLLVDRGDTVTAGQQVALLESAAERIMQSLAIVKVVGALLDTRSGTFGVRLTLPNAARLIPVGQRCTVEYNTHSVSIELA